MWFVLLGHLGDESPLALVGDVLVGAAVQLLHARQELLGRHAAHHSRDAVDHGEAVLGAGHRQVGQRHPLLRHGAAGAVTVLLSCYLLGDREEFHRGESVVIRVHSPGDQDPLLVIQPRGHAGVILPGHGQGLALHPPLVGLQVQRLHAVEQLPVHLAPDHGQEPRVHGHGAEPGAGLGHLGALGPLLLRVVPHLHAGGHLAVHHAAQHEHLVVHDGAGGLLARRQQQRVLGPGVGGEVVCEAVVADGALVVPAAAQQDLLGQGVGHGAAPRHAQLQRVGGDLGVADLGVDEVVQGLAAGQEVLAGVAAPEDHRGQRLLASLDAAATDNGHQDHEAGPRGALQRDRTLTTAPCWAVIGSRHNAKAIKPFKIRDRQIELQRCSERAV